jgi:hypothetical protein
MIIINQEADELLYRAAFACEKTCYKIEHPDGDMIDLGAAHSKPEIQTALKSKGWVEGENYKLHSYKITEPIENPLGILKYWIEQITVKGDKLRLWLSPTNGSNFRFDVATIPGPLGAGYKAGRPPRPLHYEEIREYLLEVQGAEEIQGYEADDALGIYQTSTSIASHIDKDINMIPGLHYNWVKKTLYLVQDPGEVRREGRKIVGGGFKFFCHQLLTGDRVDNIPGIKNITEKSGRNYGPVRAMKALDKETTKEELLDKVRDIYYNIYKDDWQKQLYERADLLWICRKEDERGSHILRSYYENK